MAPFRPREGVEKEEALEIARRYGKFALGVPSSTTRTPPRNPSGRTCGYTKAAKEAPFEKMKDEFC
ncbi:hypothetical protein MASR2M79_13450 [Aminivibrio sp.]